VGGGRKSTKETYAKDFQIVLRMGKVRLPHSWYCTLSILRKDCRQQRRK
jgi:hypothetical protein